MRRQTYGYLPSRKASPTIGWYQIILFGDRAVRKSWIHDHLEYHDFVRMLQFYLTRITGGVDVGASSAFKNGKIYLVHWWSTNSAFCTPMMGIYARSSTAWFWAGQNTDLLWFLWQNTGRQLHFCPQGDYGIQASCRRSWLGHSSSDILAFPISSHLATILALQVMVTFNARD